MLIALNDALFKHLSDTRQFGAVARKKIRTEAMSMIEFPA